MGSGRFAALAPAPALPPQLPTPTGLTLLDRVKRSAASIVRLSKEDILSKHKENQLPEYLEAYLTRANGLISEVSLPPVTNTPIDPNEVQKIWMKSSGGQRGVRQSTSHLGGSNRGLVGDKQWGSGGSSNTKYEDDDLWDDVNGPHGDGEGGAVDLAAMAEQSEKLKEKMDRMTQRMALLDANEQKQEQEQELLRENAAQKHEILRRKSSGKSFEGGAGREEHLAARADPVVNFQSQHWAPPESSPSSAAQQQTAPGQLCTPGVDAEAPSASRANLLSVLGIMKPNVMQEHSAEEPVALPQWPVQAQPPFESLQTTSTSSSTPPLVSSLVLPPLQHSSGSSSNSAAIGRVSVPHQQQQQQQAEMQMYLQLEQQEHQQRSRVGELRHDILEEQARQHAEHAQAVKAAAHSLAPGKQHQGLMPEHQEQVVVPSPQDMAAYLGGHAQPQHQQQPLRPSVQYNHFPHDQPPLPNQQQPTTIPSQQPVPWYYQDMQGKIQGPFSGQAMKSWLAAGYFAMDLPVRHGPVGEFIELQKRISANAEPFAERFAETIVPPTISIQLQQQQHLLQTQQDEVRQERERFEWQQRERERAVALAQARVQTEQEAQQVAHQQQQKLLQQQQQAMERQEAQMEKQQQQLQIQRKRLQLQREQMESELAKQKERQQRSAAAAAASSASTAPTAAAEAPAPPPSVTSPWGTVPLSRNEAVQSIQSIQQSILAETARKHSETVQQQYNHSSQEEGNSGERNGSMGGPVQSLPSTATWPSPPAAVPRQQHSSAALPPDAEVPVDSQGIPKLPSVPVSLMTTANPLPGRNLSQKERRALEKQRSKQRASEKTQASVQQAWGGGATSSAADACDGNDGSSSELKSMLGIGHHQPQQKAVWPSSNPQPKSLVEIQQEEERAAAQQANVQQGVPTAPLGWASRVNPNAGTGRGMNLGLAQPSQPQQQQQPQTTNGMQDPWGVQCRVVQGQGQGSGQWPQPGGQKHAQSRDSAPQLGGEGGIWDANAATSSSRVKAPSLYLSSAARETSSSNVTSTTSQPMGGTHRGWKGAGGVTGGSENVSNFGGQGIPTEMRPWATQQLTKIRGDGGDLSLLDFLMNITVISDSLIYEK